MPALVVSLRPYELAHAVAFQPVERKSRLWKMDQFTSFSGGFEMSRVELSFIVKPDLELGSVSLPLIIPILTCKCVGNATLELLPHQLSCQANLNKPEWFKKLFSQFHHFTCLREVRFGLSLIPNTTIIQIL